MLRLLWLCSQTVVRFPFYTFLVDSLNHFDKAGAACVQLENVRGKRVDDRLPAFVDPSLELWVVRSKQLQ